VDEREVLQSEWMKDNISIRYLEASKHVYYSWQ